MVNVIFHYAMFQIMLFNHIGVLYWQRSELHLNFQTQKIDHQTASSLFTLQYITRRVTGVTVKKS